REDRLAAIEGRQPVAHDLQAESSPGAGGSLGVVRVLDDDAQTITRPARLQPDGSSGGKGRDPVDDGVLDERLQEQRRHQAAPAEGRDLLLHRQALSEADLLYYQVPSR